MLLLTRMTKFVSIKFDIEVFFGGVGLQKTLLYFRTCASWPDTICPLKKLPANTVLKLQLYDEQLVNRYGNSWTQPSSQLSLPICLFISCLCLLSSTLSPPFLSVSIYRSFCLAISPFFFIPVSPSIAVFLIISFSLSLLPISTFLLLPAVPPHPAYTLNLANFFRLFSGLAISGTCWPIFHFLRWLIIAGCTCSLGRDTW